MHRPFVKKQLTLFLCATLMMPLYADNLSDKKNQLEQNKDTIANNKQEISNLEQEQKILEQEMADLDQKIISVEESLLKTESDLASAEEAVVEAEKLLNAAIEKKDIQYEATKARMVEMYKNKKVGYVQMIFSSEGFLDMLNRIEYIKVIANYDQDLLEAYNQQEEAIQAQKIVLETEKASVQTLHTTQLSQKASLDTSRQAKSSTMAKLEQQQEELYDQIDALEKASEDLEAEIKRLTAASTVKYSGGTFGWPVPGYYRISSEYNPRNSPISGIAEFHQGIDIPASYGEAVVAAADGIVITSGWVSGFGNTIIIDHGSGIVTIYGHNSSLTVSNGERVTKGQQVARIGSTGYSTGNHCHFEVRINGAHTSPWNYLKK